MTNTDVSVVIPAFNCEKTIAQTLQALQKQTFKISEIIVVDDGSTDSTAHVVRSFDHVHYVYQANAGPATARNLGASIAKGEILFFTDSDCIPQTDWIQKALNCFHEGKVAVVSGSYAIANPDELLARCIHQEIIFRHEKLMPRYPKSFGSYNFGMRKNIFEELGGFDSKYRYASGEDNDLGYKVLNAGYKIYFEKEAKVQHHYTSLIRKYLLEQYRHGFWRVKMYMDHPSMIKGDDYTYWKDIIEVPLVYLIILSFILAFLNPAFGLGSFIFLIFLVLIIVFQSFSIIKKFYEAIFFSFIVLLRAFSRVFGFSSGIIHFLLFKRGKKT